MLTLVDNNFAQAKAMRDYLAASPRNLAAIPHTLMEEWHKKRAAFTTRLSLQIACKHARQIVILRDTNDLLQASGRAQGLLLRLIDRRQTRNFATYCDSNINGPLTPDLDAQFAEYEDYTSERMALLLLEARKMWELFEKWDDPNHPDGFTDKQRKKMSGIIGRKVHLPADLQEKTLKLALKHGGANFNTHRLPQGEVPHEISELANLLSFRYGAMMVALYIYWKSEHGSSYPKQGRNVLAWLNDIKIAAQATYFDGFKTGDEKVVPVYEIRLGLIKALGGYTNCGRYETMQERLARGA